MIPHVSVRGVLDEAMAAGWLPADAPDRSRTALIAAAREGTPWYLRLLIGGAAWIGAMFLLGTVLGIVALAVGDRVDVAAVVVGLVLAPAGIRLRSATRSELARQTALVLVICGQLLVVGGLGGNASSISIAAVVLLISSVGLIVVFEDGVYRFAATLAVVGAGLALAFDAKVPYALGIATALTAIVPLVAWRVPALRSLHRVLDPVAWASAVALCGLLTTQTLVDTVTGPGGQPPDFLRLLMPTPWPLAALFVALQAWLAFQVAREHGTSPADRAPLGAVAAIVAIGLLTLSTPAIAGALLLIVLAFDRRRGGLLGLAGAFLVGFLGLYYYSLALTLLHKSIILTASGAVCLAAAAFFHAQARRVTA